MNNFQPRFELKPENPFFGLFSFFGRGFWIALVLTLLTCMLWLYVELSGLMAQQTGVREAVWMAVAVIFLFCRENRIVRIPDGFAALVLVVYLLNAIVMLWDARTPVFWISAALVIVQCAVTVFNVLKGPIPDFARRTEPPPPTELKL